MHSLYLQRMSEVSEALLREDALTDIERGAPGLRLLQ